MRGPLGNIKVSLRVNVVGTVSPSPSLSPKSSHDRVSLDVVIIRDLHPGPKSRNRRTRPREKRYVKRGEGGVEGERRRRPISVNPFIQITRVIKFKIHYNKVFTLKTN